MGQVTQAHEAVIPRISHEECTVAVVRWRGVNHPELRSALTAALTEWMRTTQEGKDAWEDSSHDFNVGDLANAPTDSSPLKELLAAQNVHDLEIDVYSDVSGDRYWTFDTLLVKADEVSSGDK